MLTRLLRRDDVASTGQILDLGFSADELMNLVAHGDLVRRHRGVYLDGRSRPSPWTLLRAALLAAGPNAFLSHQSAAAARGLRTINVRKIHVCVVASSTPRIPGLTLHRSAEPARGEVTTVGGLRVASVLLILLQLSPTATEKELRELITQGERRNSLADVGPFLARHARHPGIGRLRDLLADHQPARAHNSGLEDEVWAWYATVPELPPPDETNIRLGPHEFDGIWHEQRVVLEIDSRRWHGARADMENDRRKDIHVQKLGLRIVRITDFRFAHDRDGIRADLFHFLVQHPAVG